MFDDDRALKQKLVIHCSEVELPKQSVGALASAVADEWKKKEFGRPVRVQFTRGGSLKVEREQWVPTDASDGLVSPFEVVRGRSEFRILEFRKSEQTDPVRACLEAIRVLRRRHVSLTTVLTRNTIGLEKWLTSTAGLSYPSDADTIRLLGADIIEDPSIPHDVVGVFVGSSAGAMLEDAEVSVVLREIG
jgi:hypothetical protein